MCAELHKEKVNASKIDQKLKLELGNSASNGPPISVSLPQNLLMMFADESFSVNVTSAIYRNFGLLFSQDLSINMWVVLITAHWKEIIADI